MNVVSPVLQLPTYPQGYAIETQRLKLRAPTVADAEGLWPLVSDGRLTTYLAWEAHRDITDTEKMIAALTAALRSGLGFHWIVLASNQIAGLVSLIDVHRQHRKWTLDRAELAYWIGMPYQGRGYATEAATAAVEYGFCHLQLHKIRVYHAADNPSSGRTIQKLGFRFVGEEKEAFLKAGVWHHLRHFELLASERLKEK